MTTPTTLLAFASRWFDPATVHGTFEPLVADWQREWLDTRRSRRAIVHAKWALAFCVAAVVSMPAIIDARPPRSLTNRVVRGIAWTTGLGTLVFMFPLVSDLEPAWQRGVLILVTIPQAMTLVFPFSMVTAADAIRRATDIEPHIARAAAAKLAIFAVVFVALNHGWVVPAANQAWREMRFEGRSKPAKGPRELTTYELIAAADLATVNEPGTYEFSKAKSIRVEINNRATLALLPVFLLWRRWRALDLPPGRWFSPRHPILATIAAFGAFMALRGFFISVEKAWSLPAGSGPWIELAFLAMIGMTRVWLVERSVARAIP